MPPQTTKAETLVCLRCGTPNRSDAPTCTHCQTPLMVQDMDFALFPRISARTTVGQVRTNNEDSVGIWAGEGILIGVVADGMGGAAAGEIASQLTVQAVQTFFTDVDHAAEALQQLSEDDVLMRLRDAVHRANRSVYERAQDDSSQKGMGTTSTLALVRGNRVFVAHVGDSRAYLIDHYDGEALQITVDHSFVQALVASGHITPAQARLHPMGHVLYRALGQSLDLDVDTYSRTLRGGDRLVICSDGVTRHLSAEEIAEIVLRTEDPDEATLALLTAVNERGGEDNASVILINLETILLEEI